MFDFFKKKKVVDKIPERQNIPPPLKNRKWISLMICWKEFYTYNKTLRVIDKTLESNLPEAGITLSKGFFIQNKRRMNRLKVYPRKNKTLCLRIIGIKLHNRTEHIYRLMFWNCLSGKFVGEISYDEAKKIYRITHLSKIKNRFLKWSN